MYRQYLTSNGFRNYVASANLFFGFVINYSYSDVWELLMNSCDKWCVMMNHYDLGLLWFGLKSLVISWTTEVIWAQVWEFDRFSDCFWTCALYNLDGSMTTRGLYVISSASTTTSLTTMTLTMAAASSHGHNDGGWKLCTTSTHHDR
jgi:hypothetical protein